MSSIDHQQDKEYVDLSEICCSNSISSTSHKNSDFLITDISLFNLLSCSLCLRERERNSVCVSVCVCVCVCVREREMVCEEKIWRVNKMKSKLCYPITKIHFVFKHTETIVCQVHCKKYINETVFNLLGNCKRCFWYYIKLKI